uniref:Uncharacterized protein n=1 Tax=Oryza meridionalis TaxID=40149 RepID=A0A0E0FC10_9ORYZ
MSGLRTCITSCRAISTSGLCTLATAATAACCCCWRDAHDCNSDGPQEWICCCCCCCCGGGCWGRGCWKRIGPGRGRWASMLEGKKDMACCDSCCGVGVCPCPCACVWAWACCMRKIWRWCSWFCTTVDAEEVGVESGPGRGRWASMLEGKKDMACCDSCCGVGVCPCPCACAWAWVCCMRKIWRWCSWFCATVDAEEVGVEYAAASMVGAEVDWLEEKIWGKWWGFCFGPNLLNQS